MAAVAHVILRVALHEVRNEPGAPKPPFHLGPPIPQLDGWGAARLALFLVEDQPRLAALARKVLYEGADPREVISPKPEVLEEPARETPMDPMRWLAGALSEVRSPSTANVVWAKAIVGRRVKAMPAAERLAWCARLDDAIIGAECESWMRKLTPPPTVPAVERVLWRWGRTRAEQWVIRSRGELHAWIAAAPRSIPGKGTRRWFEGSLDDALSCVPDELFPAATETALARRREAEVVTSP